MRGDEQSYAFDNALAVQRERLRTLEALFDAGTIAHLEARGVGPGWRCLEVGGGGGSIARWLCERVAPDGSVLATDLNTTFLDELSHANLDVRVHDLLADELPQGEFDLAHLRMVLAWLPDRPAALERLVAALKPGGWLVVEELDFVSAVADPRMGADACALFERMLDAHNAALAKVSGFDAAYGRRVAGDLADAGLVDSGSEGRSRTWRGGEPGPRAWQLTMGQLEQPIVAGGLMDADDFDRAMATLADPRLSAMSPTMMAAWGRKPA